VQLLGEEVNSQVPVLASGRGGGNADDLARAALKDQQIANADVVGGDGDSVGRSGRVARRRVGASTIYGDINLLSVMVVVSRTTNNAFSCTVETVSERVVVT
jgi:hypothetical protein